MKSSEKFGRKVIGAPYFRRMDYNRKITKKLTKKFGSKNINGHYSHRKIGPKTITFALLHHHVLGRKE